MHAWVVARPLLLGAADFGYAAIHLPVMDWSSGVGLVARRAGRPSRVRNTFVATQLLLVAGYVLVLDRAAAHGGGAAVRGADVRERRRPARDEPVRRDAELATPPSPSSSPGSSRPCASAMVRSARAIATGSIRSWSCWRSSGREQPHLADAVAGAAAAGVGVMAGRAFTPPALRAACWSPRRASRRRSRRRRPSARDRAARRRRSRPTARASRRAATATRRPRPSARSAAPSA